MEAAALDDCFVEELPTVPTVCDDPDLPATLEADPPDEELAAFESAPASFFFLFLCCNAKHK